VEALLARYEALVRAWAPRLNLIALGDLDRFTDRHIADSLRLLPLLASVAEGPAVDVGSGAGLPGIPLAIHAPDRHWTLIEPRSLRAAFLEEVVRALSLNCTVVRATAQSAATRPDLAEAHMFATARALAEPSRAAALCGPLVHGGGTTAIFVGESAELWPGATLWGPGIAIVEKPA
jgi:16S rRNA (guanine527-N7)-methyltransferase